MNIQQSLLGTVNSVTGAVAGAIEKKNKDETEKEYLAGLTKARELQNAAEISEIDSQVASMEGGIKQSELEIKDLKKEKSQANTQLKEAEGLQSELDLAANSPDFIGPRMPEHTSKQKKKIKELDVDVDIYKRRKQSAAKKIKQRQIQIEATRKHIEAKQAERLARTAKQETKKGQ